MTPLERLVAAVDELTQPRTHREPLLPDMAPKDARTGQPIHGAVTTHVASLIDQVGVSVTPGTGIDLSLGHAVPGSRPTVSVEALDAGEAIRREATRTLTYLGGTDRHNLAANLRALIGHATQQEHPTQLDVAREAERWVSRAKSVTGWADAPFRPENTCPLCSHRHTLRIRATSTSDVHASCVHCGETWTPETAGLLIEHIRWENGENQEASA